jgi:hypothetical protein
MPPATPPLTIAIPGSCSLKDIKNVIRFHEAFLWTVKSVAVNGRLNVVTLDPSQTVPAELEIVSGGGAAPDGATQIWGGKLRYNGAEQPVVLYRLAN